MLWGVSTFLLTIVLLAVFWYLANRNSPVQNHRDYVGSSACGECHQREYASWAKTAHALAIQDVTKDKNPIIGQWDKTLSFQEGNLPEVTIRLVKSAEGLHEVTLIDAVDPTRKPNATEDPQAGMY